MPTAFENFVYAELPLRPALIKGATEATGDPRLSALSQVNAAPLGTLYLQDNVTPKVTWQKQGTLASQWVVISGSFGKVVVRRGLVVTSAFNANEAITLSSGAGATGAATVSGDSVTIPSNYLNNHQVNFTLNGVNLEKGIQVTHSSGTIAINIPLDPGDRIIVYSEEDL
jgi:hypothetical protein